MGIRGSAIVLVVVAAALAAPAPAAQGTRRGAEHVILITLDGVRIEEMFGGLDAAIVESVTLTGRVEDTRTWQRYWAPTAEARRMKLLPFFWGTLMVEHGSIAGNKTLGSSVLLTNGHRFSYPGYSELVTGAARDAAIDSNDKRRNPFPSVLEVVRRELGLRREEVATFASWDTFRWIVEHEEGATTVNAGYHRYDHLDADVRLLSDWQFQARTPWDEVRHDAYTLRFARAHLATHHPRLLYIALGETDDWAHEGRYDRVLEALEQFDRGLADLWNWLEGQERYRGKTMILIGTDHGRGRTPADWRSHGKDVEGAEDVWLAAVAPEVTLRGEWRNAPTVYQNQIAATAAAALGLNYQEAVPEAGEPIGSLLH